MSAQPAEQPEATLSYDGRHLTLPVVPASEGGSGVERFPEVKDNLLGQIKALRDQLDAASPAGASLDAAKAKVDGINIPEKK